MAKHSADIQERLLSPSELYEDEYIEKSRGDNVQTRQRLRWWTCINIVVSMLLFTGFLLEALPPKPQMNELWKQISYYSPVLDDINIPVTTTTVDGGIARSSKHSIARLTPGPEADAAWHRFEDIKTVVLSESDIVKLGKDPRTAVQFPDEEWHFGDSAYMGQLDVIHQIHCLNQLRKRAFVDYYPSNSTAEERQKPEWYWVHLQHCVSILLENLMCNANTEMLTLNWIEETEYPFPDFSVNKQCRDFETLLQWQEERAVDTEKIRQMKKPTTEGKVVEGEAEWWALFDKEGNAVSQEHDHSHSGHNGD